MENDEIFKLFRKGGVKIIDTSLKWEIKFASELVKLETPKEREEFIITAKRSKSWHNGLLSIFIDPFVEEPTTRLARKKRS